MEMNGQPHTAAFFPWSKMFRIFFGVGGGYTAVWSPILLLMFFLPWFDLRTIQPVAKSIRHSCYFLQGISEVLFRLEKTVGTGKVFSVFV